jgi:hypothetical protein
LAPMRGQENRSKHPVGRAEMMEEEGFLANQQRLRPERGAKPPSESERGWGPASGEKK